MSSPVLSSPVLSRPVMLLAHQGGWDEALLVAGPLLAIVGLLWLAKRRADRLPNREIPPSNNPDQPDR